MSGSPAIVASGLTRRFGQVVAVDGVDLQIPQANIFGFLGPNGSGKTTTIRMLCGLLTPSDGTAEVLNHRVPKEAEHLRRRIGYMTQHFSLYEDLSVSENLNFIARIQSLSRAERNQRLREAFNRYHLNRQAQQRAASLSGGEKQRLALAAATLHRPEILFLDEPTSAVDPQSRRDFWEGLFELVDEGTTILVSTHYMDEAERCHRLAIFDNGRVALEGEPRRLKEEIGALVLDVESAYPRRVSAQLASDPYIRSVTQLGSRLHILADQEGNGKARIHRILADTDPGARIVQAAATLEDVFVAATNFRGR